MAKPFGKRGFGEGQEGSYYFKELQTSRISKKLELIKSKLGDIKKIVILITAFTIGHTLTLILSTLNLIQYDQKIIEFAIPLTIAVTAINNIRKRNQTLLGGVNPNYYLALFFGLIHGLGFSNYLKALLIGDNIVNSYAG